MSAFLENRPRPLLFVSTSICRKGLFEVGLILGFAAILLIPELFVIYRVNAFDTIPRDPYEPYLLFLAGSDDGFLPGSPFTYRILSVVPALIPLSLVDAPLFSNIQNPQQIWLNAVFANAVVSYASIVVLSVVVYGVLRWRLGCAPLTALCGLLMVPVLSGFTATYMTDPFVILYLFVAFLLMDRFWVWLLMLVIGVGVNEKIPLIFALYSMLSLLQVRTRKTFMAFICACLACGLYLLVRSLLNFPGYENQTDIASFFDGFLNTFQMTLSFKGVIQNLLPIFILLVMALPLGLEAAKTQSYPLMPVHVLLIPGLAMVAFCTDVQWNVGRNVMHLFPLFLVPLLHWMESRGLIRESASS
jgi:hypothetical protein